MTDQSPPSEISTPSTAQKPSNSKPLIEIFITIVIPVMLLKKLPKWFPGESPVIFLLVALSLPLAYGLYDLIKEKKLNYIAILGLINITFTGGFALLKLEGIWFAVKEATIPLVIGLFFLYTTFSENPTLGKILEKSGLLNWNLISEKVKEFNTTEAFKKCIKNSNLFLAFSFFFSSALNFILAIIIFKKLPMGLSSEQHQNILNEQVAQMTWISFVVIALPSLIITGLIFYYLSKKIKECTKLNLEEILQV